MNRPYTQSQMRYLKGAAQRLEARLVVGKDGLSDAFIATVKEALGREELVKVRLGAQTDRAAKEALAQTLAEKSDSFLVTRLGHVAVLFHATGKNPQINLPT
jgi:RNA-binding protein